MLEIIPSVLDNNLNALTASSSVTDTYDALPDSLRYECSGPVPG